MVSLLRWCLYRCNVLNPEKFSFLLLVNSGVMGGSFFFVMGVLFFSGIRFLEHWANFRQ
jgi:hypothetical protein